MFSFTAQKSLVGQGLSIFEALSHSDPPPSLGLFWTSDQSDAETSTWQHTTNTRDRLFPAGVRNRKPQQASGRGPTS